MERRLELNKIRELLYKKPEIRRFIKFCIVGASSFIFGFLVFNIAYALTGKLIFSSTLAYVLSVLNGFIWNRSWTFRDRRKKPVWNQALKFAISNAFGYSVNLITYTVFLAMVGAFQGGAYDSFRFWSIASEILHGHAPHYSFLIVNLAGLTATAVVIIINYFANRFWAFK